MGYSFVHSKKKSGNSTSRGMADKSQEKVTEILKNNSIPTPGNPVKNKRDQPPAAPPPPVKKPPDKKPDTKLPPPPPKPQAKPPSVKPPPAKKDPKPPKANKPKKPDSKGDIESRGNGGSRKASKSKEKKLSTPEERKVKRELTYLIISITLQVLCAIIVVAILLWVTIQAMRIVNLLGISSEPPGIAYVTDGSGFTPFPPNAPPQFLFGL